MKTPRFLPCWILICLFLLGTAWGYDALEGPTEMLYWDATRAYSGYTLFGVRGTTYLVDMEGRVVHTWPVGTNPHLLDNGHVLDAATDDPSGFGGFKEVDWNGAMVWQYTDKRSTYHPHHDFTRIYNPKLKAYTTLYIANKDLTVAQCLAAGAKQLEQNSKGAQMDAIVEVDMAGKVVWEWCFFDHLVQDADPTKSNYVGAGKTIADYPGRLNINLPGKTLRNDWLHCNSLDYNAELDQIVVNSVQGEFYVIDHGGTFIAGDPTTSIAKAASSSGDFLYRFGDPARYSQGDPPAVLEDWTQSTNGHKQLGGAHDVQWIGPGLTGAGHLLIFDNAQYLSEHTAQSYVLEIDPFLNAQGEHASSYVNPPVAGYDLWEAPAVTEKTPKKMSRQIVWSHSSLSSLTLFSHIGCSAQRLPNGNTLICADTEGYITEVTAEGQVVWEYIVPVTPSGVVLAIGDNLPMVNSIFRAYRYGADHPALAGRTLTPGKTIAGRTTVTNPYAGTEYQALQRPTELQYWDAVRAYLGYTLFAAQGTSYLIDMNGQVVRTWPVGTNPRLSASGNLLDIAADANGLVELDWNKGIVWQYREARALYHLHDDFVRIFNKKLNAWTTLYLAGKDLTATQCLAAGCDPADGPYTGARAETVVEVDMQGNVIWEWCFFDHAVQDVDASKANYVGAGKKIMNYPGRINLNLPGRPVRSNWLHCNSLDYNPALDQIVVNCEEGEFYVIDHGGTFVAGDPVASIAKAATSAGDFLYRFGDPAMYGQGNPPSVSANWDSATNGNKQIGASNNAQWIGTGLPGAGHLLVFSNNQYLFQRTPQSYVLEINPFVGANGTDTGAYVNPPIAGYTQWTFDKDTHKSTQQLSKQVVWKYGSVGNLALFSHFGSSAQRLPNGNTLICATGQGYLVEVTSAGQVVWEYICPVTTDGIVTALGDRLPMTNAVPRAYRYGVDFAGFQGRDLTAGTTIASRTKAISSLPAPGTGAAREVLTGGAAGPIGGLAGAVVACLAGAMPQTTMPFDVLLGRPTDRSVAVSVLADTDLQVFVEYGTQPSIYPNQTGQTAIPAGTPTVLNLDSLQPDGQYYYRLRYRQPGAASFDATAEATFHAQRKPGSVFLFDIEADPHHQDNDPDVFRLALANIVADQPDFLIDLGDTFMTEKLKVSDYAGAAQLCRDLRTGFYSIAGPSVPLLLINGNHEAELGWQLNSARPADNIAVWSTQARQLFYPCPIPGGFYSSSMTPDVFLQKPRDSFYAFEWGDALFVILDPFWYTSPKPSEGWGWTLGLGQYQWLTQTLTHSKATFKFVFIHHLVGGSFDGIARGGTEFSSFFEWGGHNQDGTWGFTAKRPGWPMPIQDLLLKNGVNIVFHGHDHFFDKQDLDADGDGVTDLIYQLVPQPSRLSSSKLPAASYGYTEGMILGSSGHLRVQVAPGQAKVEYVRAVVPADKSSQQANRVVSYSYSITPQSAAPQKPPQAAAPQELSERTIILGRPTDRSITANVLSPSALEIYFEYGLQPGVYLMQTPVVSLPAGEPSEVVMDRLAGDLQYYYRLRFKTSGQTEFQADPERTFHTQRLPDSTFTFDIQGDSHPERVRKEFNADLYIRTLQTAVADRPDFYMTIGDDFSVDTLKTVNAQAVQDLYVQQRQWLGMVGSPLFLVNGNHEQAALANLDGTPDNVAVWAQTARNSLYPQPAPDLFYSGDTEPVEFIGLLRDYYAFTWGDALFVVIDPYWHSPQAVDNPFGRDHDPKGNRDLWDITLGPAQYQWFGRTLETSAAKYKFVFTHHVLGTQRGGIELARSYEWGGNNADGTYGFDTRRPGWGKPIHRLMADNHVTIFFQGHDHIFVHQELDGVVYQSLPEPADPNYALYHADAYRSGDKLSNTGYTRVTVAPAGVRVEYVRTFLPADEGPGQVSGAVAYSYTVPQPAAAGLRLVAAPTTPPLYRTFASIVDTTVITRSCACSQRTNGQQVHEPRVRDRRTTEPLLYALPVLPHVVPLELDGYRSPWIHAVLTTIVLLGDGPAIPTQHRPRRE